MFSDRDIAIAKGEDARIFNNIIDNSCIHKNCNSRAINSHTFPENYLINNFASKINSKNLVYAMTPGRHYIEKPNINKGLESKKNIHFFESSTKNAGSLPLFCAHHDSLIFSPVDNIPFESNIKNNFLNFYRHFAFTYVQEKYFDTINDHDYENPALSPQAKSTLKVSSEIFNKYYKYDKTPLDNYLAKIHSIFRSKDTLSEELIESEFIIRSYEVEERLPWCASGTTSFDANFTNGEIWITLIIQPESECKSKIIFVCDKSREDEFYSILSIFDGYHNSYKEGRKKEFLACTQYFSILACKNFIVDYQLYASNKNRKLIDNLNHSVQLASLGQGLEGVMLKKSIDYKTQSYEIVKKSILLY